MLKISRVIAAIVLSVSLATATAASTTDPIQPVPQESFKAIVILPPVVDSLQTPPVTTAKPSIKPPKTEVKVEPKPTKKPSPTRQATVSSGTLKGKATWYCLEGRSSCHYAQSSGHYAAAGPALRKWLGPKWRNDTVRVYYGSKHVDVKLIDWCACGNGRIIDLYSYAFDNLAPLGRGEIAVKIRKLN